MRSWNGSFAATRVRVGHRLFVQPLPRHHAVHEPELLRLVRVDEAALEEDLLRLPRVQVPRHREVLEVRRQEHRILGREHHVRGRGDDPTREDAVPLHRRDRRLRDVPPAQASGRCSCPTSAGTGSAAPPDRAALRLSASSSGVPRSCPAEKWSPSPISTIAPTLSSLPPGHRRRRALRSGCGSARCGTSGGSARAVPLAPPARSGSGEYDVIVAAPSRKRRPRPAPRIRPRSCRAVPRTLPACVLPSSGAGRTSVAGVREKCSGLTACGHVPASRCATSTTVPRSRKPHRSRPPRPSSTGAAITPAAEQLRSQLVSFLRQASMPRSPRPAPSSFALRASAVSNRASPRQPRRRRAATSACHCASVSHAIAIHWSSPAHRIDPVRREHVVPVPHPRPLLPGERELQRGVTHECQVRFLHRKVDVLPLARAVSVVNRRQDRAAGRDPGHGVRVHLPRVHRRPVLVPHQRRHPRRRLDRAADARHVRPRPRVSVRRKAAEDHIRAGSPPSPA